MIHAMVLEKGDLDEWELPFSCLLRHSFSKDMGKQYLSFFSCCHDKIVQEKQQKGERVYFSSQFKGVVHHDGKGVEAGA